MINYYYKSMRFCSLHIGDFELAPISQPIHEKQEDILPLISIVMPVMDSSAAYLNEALTSTLCSCTVRSL